MTNVMNILPCTLFYIYIKQGIFVSVASFVAEDSSKPPNGEFMCIMMHYLIQYLKLIVDTS